MPQVSPVPPGRSGPEPTGVLAGLGAYVLWGMFPLYFLALDPATPTEILAHRIAWTLVFLLVLLAATRTLRRLWGLSPATWGWLSAASVLISVNWGVFVYAVTSGQGSEAALGYFVHPIVSVLFGVAFYAERLRRSQLAGVLVAVLAVVVLSFGYGRLPVVAVVLAVSFAGYGAVKKRIALPSTVSLTAEVVLVAPFAVGFLGWLAVRGDGTFGQVSPGHTGLLVLAGVVTGLPLLLFGFSAQRMPLGLLGMLFYVNPCLQLALAVTVVGERLSPVQWAGFGLVLGAVVVFTWHQSRTMRHWFVSRRRARSGGVVPGA